MDIYLIRHAQTDGNLSRRHQIEHSHLTDLGKQQAAALARFAASLKPTHLIVSSRVRAIETGQAIAAATDLMPETSELFMELCRPNDITGHKHVSLRSFWYIARWFITNRGEAYCGPLGESRQAFYTRIAAAKLSLAQLPRDARVVVISHSVFISFFVASLTRKKIPWWLAPVIFYRLFTIKNAAVTQFSYDHQKECFSKPRSIPIPR